MRFIASIDTFRILQTRDSIQGPGNLGYIPPRNHGRVFKRLQSAGTISAIVAGAPQLRVLAILPEDVQMHCNHQAEVARALASCADLEPITMIQNSNIPLVVLPAVLAHSSRRRDGVSGSGESIWEDHYRLRRMSNGRKEWRIGSYPGIGGNVEGLANGQVGEAKREVFSRDISGRVPDESEVESEVPARARARVDGTGRQGYEPIRHSLRTEDIYLRAFWKDPGNAFPLGTACPLRRRAAGSDPEDEVFAPK
ncbi:hypothetical protein PG989_003829 [Apiospora arundinis]